MVIFSTIASISGVNWSYWNSSWYDQSIHGSCTVRRSRCSLLFAEGISEALVNTAFGITGSTLAIIAFNYFSSTIDSYTFKIDEAGFSLTQNFAAFTEDQLILNLSFGLII